MPVYEAGKHTARGMASEAPRRGGNRNERSVRGRRRTGKAIPKEHLRALLAAQPVNQYKAWSILRGEKARARLYLRAISEFGALTEYWEPMLFRSPASSAPYVTLLRQRSR